MLYDCSLHNQHESLDNSQKRLQKKLDSHENCETPVQEKTDKRVEEQNAEAIQSIIESSKSQTETQNQQQVTYNGKNDVIVFDGTLDKYILSNACSIPAPVQQQTPFVLNTNGGLLMVPSTMPPTIAQAPGNQYYILNKPPLLNCFVPQQTVLTETDILAMPTVILNDDKPASKSSKKRKSNYEISLFYIIFHQSLRS